ncbi:MAG: glucose-1-phosphate cytidylyltransferase [Stygiobacter sp.]|nr:MAG: glucose-1-phosphate cytidylyltransferase [Stygiobacter sp.]
MQTVILAGGMGTRLKEETEYIPKPLVKIGPRPIIWHIMKRYANYGFKDFVISLGYKGELIKEYFANYDIMNSDISIKLGGHNDIDDHKYIKKLGRHDESVDWNLILSNTGLDTLKGARLKRIEKYIRGDLFMATYGDGVSDVNIEELVSYHKSHGKIATLTGVFSPSRFGVLETKNNFVTRFMEKPSEIGALVNGGYFVFHRKIFDYLSADENCDLEFGTLEKLASENELMVYRHRGNWYSMDTIRDVEYLNKLWQQKKAFWEN